MKKLLMKKLFLIAGTLAVIIGAHFGLDTANATSCITAQQGGTGLCSGGTAGQSVVVSSTNPLVLGFGAPATSSTAITINNIVTSTYKFVGSASVTIVSSTDGTGQGILTFTASGGSGSSTNVFGTNGVHVTQTGINATATLDTTFAAVWTAIETFSNGLTANGQVTLASTTNALLFTNSSGNVLAYNATVCGAGNAFTGLSATGTPTCSPFLTSGVATTTITAGGGTATGPAFTFATSTASGKFTIVCGTSTCTLTIPPSSDYLSSSTTYVSTFNTRSGAVTLTSGDVTTALGFTPISTVTINSFAGTTFNITGAGNVTSSVSSGNTTFSLINSGASAGSYNWANLTVSSSGIVTAVSGNATPVTSLTAGGCVTVSGSTGAITLGSTCLTGTKVDSLNGITGATIIAGGTGIGVTSSSQTITVSNTGVTSIVAGTNITISGSTGAVTINSSGGGLATTTPYVNGNLTLASGTALSTFGGSTTSGSGNCLTGVTVSTSGTLSNTNTACSGGSGLTGNGTSTWIPIYNASQTLQGYANLTFTSSTNTLAVGGAVSFPLTNASGTEIYTLQNDTSGFLEINETGTTPGNGSPQPYNIILQNITATSSASNAESTISQSVNFSDGSRTFTDWTTEQYPPTFLTGFFETATGASGSSSQLYPFGLTFTPQGGGHHTVFQVTPLNVTGTWNGVTFTITGNTSIVGAASTTGNFAVGASETIASGLTIASGGANITGNIVATGTLNLSNAGNGSINTFRGSTGNFDTQCLGTGSTAWWCEQLNPDGTNNFTIVDSQNGGAVLTANTNGTTTIGNSGTGNTIVFGTTTTSVFIPNVTSSLDLLNSAGKITAYGGASACAAGNAVTTISATGSTTCGAFGSSTSTGANPTATVGTTAVNGTANTFMRSDAAPAINQAATFAFSALGNTTSTANVGAATLNASTSITNQSVTSSLVLNNAVGLEGVYGGTSCGLGQAVKIISASGTATCAVYLTSGVTSFNGSINTVNYNTLGTGNVTTSVATSGGNTTTTVSITGVIPSANGGTATTTALGTCAFLSTCGGTGSGNLFVAPTSSVLANNVVAFQSSASSTVKATSSIYALNNGDVTLGSSSDNGLFSVVNASGTPVVKVSSTTNPTSSAVLLDLQATSSVFQILASGHINATGTVPSMGTCGTSPSVVGNDAAGTITIGSGVVTSCTLNFAIPYESSNISVLESDNSTAVTGDVTSITTSSVTFGFSATLGGGKLYYMVAENL